ncbi:MAG TPA: VCBS repeat-containing protein, partial [Candidatus Acidoferrum sp.]|nr:VCBS repeat-containing protein [Candidatus Acidoferrum sp.]
MRIMPVILTLGIITASFASARFTVVPIPPDFDVKVIPVGKGPAPIAIADVNHDGKPDIIAANTDDQTISVLLGDGKRNFAPAPGSPFACGKGPNDIAATDMNGDGNLDLVIANTGTPYLTILLGDGKGGFKPSPHSPFATESHPHVHGVAVADFTGDGKPDVATDSWGRDEILMMPGDGEGNLILPGTAFHTGKRPYQRLRSADFNKDGNPDIVTTDLGGNTVTILLGDGKGGFRGAPGSPFPAGVYPWGVAIDDLNKDGNLDLAVIPYDAEIHDPKQLGVSVLFGDGKGSFATMPGSPLSLVGCAGPDRVATGDINGDGFRDIVVSCAQNDKLFFFLGAKNGAYQVSTRGVPTGWSGLAIADLDGDGKDDIVVSNNSAGTITVL